MNKKKYASDQDLLAGLQAQEEEAFQEMYARYFTMVQHFTFRNWGNLEETRDLFQETLVQLFLNIRKEGFTLTSKLGTYLYSIARNKWMEQLRAKARATQLKDTREWEEVELENPIATEREERFLAMEKGLEQLKEDCRTLLRLFYFNRLSLGIIAEKMGYTSEFVKQKKRRCMAKLSEYTMAAWTVSDE